MQVSVLDELLRQRQALDGHLNELRKGAAKQARAIIKKYRLAKRAIRPPKRRKLRWLAA